MQRQSFFLAGSFSNKAVVFFQTIESAKRTFAARAGSGNPAFLHALFLENEKRNCGKNYEAIFSR